MLGGRWIQPFFSYPDFYKKKKSKTPVWSPASSPPMPILWRPCPAPSHHGGHHLFWDSFSTNVWWQFQMAFSDWNFMLGSFYSSCLGNFMGIIHNSRATLVWVGVIIHLSTQLQTHLLSLSLSLLSLFGWWCDMCEQNIATNCIS